MVILAARRRLSLVRHIWSRRWRGPTHRQRRTASFAVLFALLGLAAVWALGLFSARQRAGFTGMTLRTAAGALIAGVLGYLLSRITTIGEIDGQVICLITLAELCWPAWSSGGRQVDE